MLGEVPTSSAKVGIRKHEMSDFLKVMQCLNGRAKNTAQDSQLSTLHLQLLGSCFPRGTSGI